MRTEVDGLDESFRQLSGSGLFVKNELANSLNSVRTTAGGAGEGLDVAASGARAFGNPGGYAQADGVRARQHDPGRLDGRRRLQPDPSGDWQQPDPRRPAPCVHGRRGEGDGCGVDVFDGWPRSLARRASSPGSRASSRSRRPSSRLWTTSLPRRRNAPRRPRRRPTRRSRPSSSSTRTSRSRSTSAPSTKPEQAMLNLAAEQANIQEQLRDFNRRHDADLEPGDGPAGDEVEPGRPGHSAPGAGAPGPCDRAGRARRPSGRSPVQVAGGPVVPRRHRPRWEARSGSGGREGGRQGGRARAP